MQMGAGTNGPGGRRALELILSGGLKSLARPAKPVRRAASRDSVLSQPQPLLEGKYLSLLPHQIPYGVPHWCQF